MATVHVDEKDLENRMAAVRARLHQESLACQRARERWTDWRTHVKAHPWLACGVAAIVGYAVVPGPRRKETSAASLALPMYEAAPRASFAGKIASTLGQRLTQQALSFGATWALTQITAAMNARHPMNSPNQSPPASSEAFTYAEGATGHG